MSDDLIVLVGGMEEVDKTTAPGGRDQYNYRVSFDFGISSDELLGKAKNKQSKMRRLVTWLEENFQGPFSVVDEAYNIKWISDGTEVRGLAGTHWVHMNYCLYCSQEDATAFKLRFK